jgi:Na+(H+)/acetate symporter ActP
MFAISVPIFVLMAVYGHYGSQLGANGNVQHSTFNIQRSANPPTGVSEVESSKLNVERSALPDKAPADSTWLSPFGPLTTKAAKAANLSAEESRPYSLLYTYSLIIALVCGTAGLPHILVRFYTNPDGVAAKRTTMWVMILIGVFYLFPPIFGVLGRNLLPELYAATGAKGTDKIVLELPRILNEQYAPLGSILSGITCAGAFAAFMSTFSGLLVSMTGALAHDVYGRMLRPRSTPEQRMKAFRVAAVVIGAVAILLGMQVEPYQLFSLTLHECLVAWNDDERRGDGHVDRRAAGSRGNHADQFQRFEMAATGRILGNEPAASDSVRATGHLDRAARNHPDGRRQQVDFKGSAVGYPHENVGPSCA